MTTDPMTIEPTATAATITASMTTASTAIAVGQLDQLGQISAAESAQIFRRGATGVPPMLLEIPVNFLPYPMQEDPAERQAAAEEFVRALYKNGDEDLWRSTAPAIAGIGEITAGAGIEWAGMAVFDNEQGGVATCTLTVAATESDHLTPEVAALAIREVLVRDEFNDSRWLNLPCGPAVSRITITKFPLDSEVSGGVEGAELVQGQIQVYVPFPTGPYVAILTMQTSNMEVWVPFSQMMATIVQTISFPGAPAAPQAPGSPTAEGAPEAAIKAG